MKPEDDMEGQLEELQKHVDAICETWDSGGAYYSRQQAEEDLRAREAYVEKRQEELRGCAQAVEAYHGLRGWVEDLALELGLKVDPNTVLADIRELVLEQKARLKGLDK